MPSRKGKGRQSLGFARKSQRAQFHHEWQTRLHEDYYAEKQQRQRSTTATGSKIRMTTPLQQQRQRQQPPKVEKNCLRRLLAERQYWDRVEDRTWILSQSQASGARLAATSSTTGARVNVAALSRPGWLVYHGTRTDETDSFASEFLRTTPNDESNQVPTLQSLALAVLARALPDYLDAMGADALHHVLSLLPGPALAVLSVEVSRAGSMTTELGWILGRQSHLTRFSLTGARCDDETDPSYKALDGTVALQSILAAANPRQQTTTTLPIVPMTTTDALVPDSWEELLVLLSDEENNDTNDDVVDDEDRAPGSSSSKRHQPLGNGTPSSSLLLPLPLLSSSTSSSLPLSLGGGGCSSFCWQKLERLELGNLPLLQVDVLRQVLTMCPLLTHLGLSGSLTYYGDRGPDVLWHLREWVPQLLVLDVSGNTSWITEPLLRTVYESYYCYDDDDYNDDNMENEEEGEEDSSDNHKNMMMTMMSSWEDDMNDNNNSQQRNNHDHDSSSSLFSSSTTRTRTAATTSNNSTTATTSTTNNNTTTAAAATATMVQQQQHPVPARQQKQPHRQSSRPRRLIIKATGCLSRSSQILMEMEFGTIF